MSEWRAFTQGDVRLTDNTKSVVGGEDFVDFVWAYRTLEGGQIELLNSGGVVYALEAPFELDFDG